MGKQFSRQREQQKQSLEAGECLVNSKNREMRVWLGRREGGWEEGDEARAPDSSQRMNSFPGQNGDFGFFPACVEKPWKAFEQRSDLI